MRLYVKCFYTGVMPGPFAYMRDILVPCEPRPITEPRISSSIDSVINERAGLTRNRRLVDSWGIVQSNLRNGRTIYSRMYGVDSERESAQ